MLKPDQSGQLAADLVESYGGNRGSGVADRARPRIDAPHMAGQDLSGTPLAFRIYIGYSIDQCKTRVETSGASSPSRERSRIYFARFQTMVDWRPLVVRGIVLVHSSPARLTVLCMSVPA